MDSTNIRIGCEDGEGCRCRTPTTSFSTDEVQKRLKNYGDILEKQPNGGAKEETQALMLHSSDREDSDLENNVNRLCQYLSGSECDESGENQSSSPEIKRRRPKSEYIPSDCEQPVYSLACHNRLREDRRTRNNRPVSRRYSANFVEHSSPANVSLVKTERGSSPDLKLSQLPVMMNCADSTELQHLAPGSGYNPRRVGRPVLPQSFLNIPPPTYSPDASPTLQQRTVPSPPQRQLPPVPNSSTPVTAGEEAEYEEAKEPLAHGISNTKGNLCVVHPDVAMNGYELSKSAAARTGRNRFSPNKAGCDGPNNRYNDIDWDQFRGGILRVNPDTGSFYIPSSGHTTMSSLSPQSGRMDMDPNNKHYSFLPAAGTTVPVSVMPMRPETTGSSVHTNQGLKQRVSAPPSTKPAKHRTMSWCCMEVSWKCVTYCLAALLIFCMAVIVYLLVSIFTNTQGAGYYYPNGTPIHGVHSTPSVSGANGEKETVIPILRPLPESFSLGDPVVADLPSGRLAYSYFTLQRDSWVRFNLSVEPQAKLAIYGRQTVLPTPTQHDFVKIILGEKLHAQPQRRSAIEFYGYPEKNLRNTLFVQFLVAGRWNLGFLNDDNQLQTLKFSAALRADAGSEDCKYGCYGKGVCKDGKCYCFEGFTGLYCEETICPVLCSGNGVFSGGRCHCHQSWKGLDCDVPDNVCEIPNCSDRGRCNSRGECDCEHGWTGKFCEEKACPQKNCSSHGVCVRGVCYCEFGWKGAACEEAYTAQGLCPSSEKCSKQGTWDVLQGVCRCEIGWTGEACQIKLCNLFCGTHGRCEGDGCVCDKGWSGEKCDYIACGPGCEENGLCQNGTCHCKKGWNGKNCQLNGCPNSCNFHGECTKSDSNWMCICNADYSGSDCSVPMESGFCNDGKDNDGDGLIDCADSECCNSASCQANTFCLTVPDPQTILLREQAPPPQASFFQKIRFLIESDSSGSVQQYSALGRFNETRASVIRGRVLHSKGGPLIGVRISDMSDPLYGFTISRAGGKFDLIVNGGGSVTLKFMRQHLGSTHRTVHVPWNRIVVMDDVIMSSNNEERKDHGLLRGLSSVCSRQQREHWIRPYLLPSWQVSRFGGLDETGSEGNGRLMADSRTVHETLRLPGTNSLYLSYSSAQADGYQSALSLYLVPENMPESLRLVKLKIDVAGIRFEKTLEAQPNLTYWYGWDKRNVYKQKVFGLTTANVGVGYIYSGCDEVFWEFTEVKLNGYKSAVSDLGGWNLNIHHHFDILDGVLDKGDGSTVYINEESPMLTTSVGTGRQRALDCTFCNGEPTEIRLFQPQTLAAAKNGALFIGDYNLIRRLTPNKTVVTVLQLSPSDTAHKYYMAVHPVTNHLYISLPLRRQIWKLSPPKEDGSSDTSWNYEAVVGNGKSCTFPETCGDGGPAKMASLTFPKGLAFDSQGSLYFADERRIRLVTKNGLIQTVLGGYEPRNREWKPLGCNLDFKADKFALQWPTGLTVDPLSDNLLILDSDMIFRLKTSESIRLEVGTPPHCSELTDSLNRTRAAMPLKDSTGISVDSRGRILVSESDGKRINRIRSFDLHGRSDLVAGAESNCDCHPRNCPCDDTEFTLAKDARLHRPSAIAVDQAGLIHIADQGNFKIKTVQPVKPKWDPVEQVYQIYPGDSQGTILK